jgi:predicted ATP-dependent endonuclease of OLD family
MRLRRLEIENFRGVKSLDWRHIAETAALVGPGDSGKSTILDAIERVLSPRWNVSFDDTDFWDLQTTTPIVIRACVRQPSHITLRNDRSRRRAAAAAGAHRVFGHRRDGVPNA